MTELEQRAVDMMLRDPRTFIGRISVGERLNVRRPVVFKGAYDPIDIVSENYDTVVITPEMMKALGR